MPSHIPQRAGTRTARIGRLLLIGLFLLIPGQSSAQKRCKGTKQWHAGACRYPEEIAKLKQSRVHNVQARGSAAASRLKWIKIPGGSFVMGSDSGASDEKPVHRVTLATFELTRSEVTTAQYQRCHEDGVCAKPASGQFCNWKKVSRAGHPVNCVDWNQARTFCDWVGGRLPSEAEWEYAARSGGKAWTYPWGNVVASCARTVMEDGSGIGCGEKRTVPVCSKPRGNSKQGLCDMVG